MSDVQAELKDLRAHRGVLMKALEEENHQRVQAEIERDDTRAERDALKAELAAYRAAAESTDLEGDARDHFADLADWDTPNGETPEWLVDAVMGFIAPHVCAASAAEYARDQAETERDALKAKDADAAWDESVASDRLTEAQAKRDKAEHQRDRYRLAWQSARGRAKAYGESIGQRCEERDLCEKWFEEAAAERDALKVAAQKARECHPRDDSNPRGPWCPTCLTAWPCWTLAALDTPGAPDSPQDTRPQETRDPADSPSGELPGPLPPATAGDSSECSPEDTREETVHPPLVPVFGELEPDPGCSTCGTCMEHDGCADAAHPPQDGDCETCGACRACIEECAQMRADARTGVSAEGDGQ